MRKICTERSVLPAMRRQSGLPSENELSDDGYDRGETADRDEVVTGEASGSGNEIPDEELREVMAELKGRDDDDQSYELPDEEDIDEIEGNKEVPTKKPRYTVVDAAVDGPATASLAPEGWSSMVPPQLESEAIRLVDKQVFKYPWEKGHLSHIFTKKPLVKCPALKLQPGTSSLVRVHVAVGDGAVAQSTMKLASMEQGSAIYPKVVKKIAGSSYLEERDSRRAAAVKLWWELLALSPTSHDPGIAAAAEAHVGEEEACALVNLDACFAVRSPNTILKRYYAIRAFQEWLKSDGPHDWLPFSEPAAWAYIRDLQWTGKPPTRASSFLEAVRFCHFVLSVEGALRVLESPRIRGLASKLLASKKPWRPSDAFTVDQVKLMRKALADVNKDLVDRVIVGHLLFMTYGRCRWSDTLALQNVYVDEQQAFVESMAALHKGARHADAKSRLLPVVVPCTGIVPGNWAMEYMAIRNQAGLELPGEKPHFMLPAPSHEGGGMWSKRYLTSQEGNAFIQKFFLGTGRRHVQAEAHDALLQGHSGILGS